MNALDELNIVNKFSELGEDFFQRKNPDTATEPYLVSFNPEGARLLDLSPEQAESKDFIETFAGNQIPAKSDPLAMVYSGYQFGVYNPQLGDGRGILLGEVINEAGQSWDLYLKGAGPTRFARGFDGRATLRSSIREYLCGEAMYGLGIPTTRSLAIVGIRDLIYREMPELAAVLVRLSPSHIRFGSFEYFYHTQRPHKVTALMDFVIQQYFPDFIHETDKYRLTFREIIDCTARTISQWQAVGFGHGVMNTDNMSILGLTFDYGPFGFMDIYNPQFIPNHSDTHGRYSFFRQAEIAYWNLSKLGVTLRHLIAPEDINSDLDEFQPRFNQYYRLLMAEKMGLAITDEEFRELVRNMFNLLFSAKLDYSNFMRNLSDFPSKDSGSFSAGEVSSSDWAPWFKHYRKLINREEPDDEERKQRMDNANPKFILRNYLAQRAIDKALKESDFSEIERLRILLQNPFKDQLDLFEKHGIDPEFYSADTPESLTGIQVSCSA